MNKSIRSMLVAALLASSICLMPMASSPAAQTLSGQSLVTALRQGGYVIVMRHASSPGQPPDKQAANPDNVNVERQLDEAGRTSAIAMGKALRDLKIPIGEVLTSPTYRANETVRLAQFPNPKQTVEIGDNGQSMQGGTEAQAAWLQKRITQAAVGTNTILITHMPNISRAFTTLTPAAVADGEALIFHPDGKGAAPLVARIKIDEWVKL